MGKVSFFCFLLIRVGDNELFEPQTSNRGAPSRCGAVWHEYRHRNTHVQCTYTPLGPALQLARALRGSHTYACTLCQYRRFRPASFLQCWTGSIQNGGLREERSGRGTLNMSVTDHTICTPSYTFTVIITR